MVKICVAPCIVVVVVICGDFIGAQDVVMMSGDDGEYKNLAACNAVDRVFDDEDDGCADRDIR